MPPKGSKKIKDKKSDIDDMEVQSSKNSMDAETGFITKLISLFNKVQSAKTSEEMALPILNCFYMKAIGENIQDENVETLDFPITAEIFNKCLASVVTQNFPISERSFPVERSLKFYAHFVCNCIEKELPYVDQFLWLVSEFHNDDRKSFRLRTCQVILWVMSQCAKDDLDIADSSWNSLRDVLLVRSRDKVTEIRSVAVKALVHFQPGIDPDEDDPVAQQNAARALDHDPVVKQLAFILEVEQIIEIRKTVLSAMIVNNATMLKCLIRHCRDVDMHCRAVALQTLAHSVTVKALTFQQRVDILAISFRNSSQPPIDLALKNLINLWLAQVGGGISDLLHIIDPIVNKELCGKMVDVILKSLPSPDQAVQSFDILDEQKLIPDKWCSPENVFQWLQLLQFLKSNNQSELLEKVSPNASTYAQFLAHNLKRIGETDLEDELISRTFIAEQLLEIAGMLDVSMDEIGRKNLTKVLELNLKNCFNSEYSRLVKPEMELLLKLLGKQKFVHSALNAISELRFPLGGVSSADIEVQNSRAELNDNTKGGAADQGEARDEPMGVVDTGENEEEDVNESMMRERQFELAKLRVEIHKQRDIMDSYVAERDFVKAQAEKEALNELERQKDELQKAIAALKSGSSDTAGERKKEDEMVEAEEKDKEDETDGETVKPSQGPDKSEETKDPIAIFQWLSIAHRIPQMVFFNSLPVALAELRQSLIGRLATAVDALRMKVVQCIGVYSIFEREYASQMLPLIVQVVIMDKKETVQLKAFRVLMDILLRYGLSIAGDHHLATEAETTGVLDLTSLNDTFLNHAPIIAAQSPNLDNSGDPTLDDSPENSNPTAMMGDADDESPNSQRLLKLVMKYLDNVNSEMRTVAAEGLAKLMLHDRICSPEIFVRLCILWFSPTSKQEPYLKQCLGQFFPLFAIASTKHQDCVRHSFMPILRTIFKAPLSSPLATIDCELLTKYLVTLTSPCNEKLVLQDPNGLTIVKQAAVHEKLGKQLCEEILKKPEENYVPNLIKALTFLEIDTECTVLTQQAFLDYLISIEQVLEPGVPKRTVSRLKAKLSSILNNESMRCSSLATNDPNASTDSRASSVRALLNLNDNNAPLHPIAEMPDFSVVSEMSEMSQDETVKEVDVTDDVVHQKTEHEVPTSPFKEISSNDTTNVDSNSGDGSVSKAKKPRRTKRGGGAKAEKA